MKVHSVATALLVFIVAEAAIFGEKKKSKKPGELRILVPDVLTMMFSLCVSFTSLLEATNSTTTAAATIK